MQPRFTAETRRRREWQRLAFGIRLSAFGTAVFQNVNNPKLAVLGVSAPRR